MMGQNENTYEQGLKAHQQALEAHFKAEQDLINLQQKQHAMNLQHHQQLNYPSQSNFNQNYQPPIQEDNQPVPNQNYGDSCPPQQKQVNGAFIEIMEATNLKDVDVLSKIDPYVVITAGHETQRTKAMKNAGTNPHFNTSIDIRIHPGVEEINFEVFDSNKYLADEFIGSGRIGVQELREHPRIDRWLSLSDNSGGNCGQLHLILSPRD